MSYLKFIKFNKSQTDTILSINKIYIDLTNNFTAGLLLSQIVYWNMPTNGDPTKRRCGAEYIIKQRKDWYEEIRITVRQYESAIRILLDLNFVTTKTVRSKYHNGNVAVKITLNFDVLMHAIENFLGKKLENADDEKTLENTQIEMHSTQIKSDANTKKGQSLNTETIAKTITKTISTREISLVLTNASTNNKTRKLVGLKPKKIITENIISKQQNNSPPIASKKNKIKTEFEIKKTHLHNELCQFFKNKHLELHSIEYYHDAKEAGAVNLIIKRALFLNQDFSKANKFLKTKLLDCYLKIRDPKTHYWSEKKFKPSTVLGEWNNLGVARPIKKNESAKIQKIVEQRQQCQVIRAPEGWQADY